MLDGLEVNYILSIGYLHRHNVTLLPSQGLLTFQGKEGEPIVICELLDNKSENLKVNKVSWMTPCISAKQ